MNRGNFAFASGVILAASLLAVAADRPALPPGFDEAPAGGKLTSADFAKIEKGGILVHLTATPGEPIKKSVALAKIDAAPEAVFAVLTNYDEFPKFMPYCTSVKVQKREGEHSWVKFELDFPWPIGDRHYVVKVKDALEDADGTPLYASRWTYVPGSGNIKDSRGSWEILPYGEGASLARYTLFTDPGGKIPKWANNMTTEVAVPKVIEGLRGRVKETAGEK